MNARSLTGRSVWSRALPTALRSFLRTESGSARVLLVATCAALAWTNLDPSSYQALWSTRLGISVGSWSTVSDLRAWLNGGLMTLFFLVVGLEARRELDLGELRDRRRLLLPALAGIGGTIVPVAVFLAVNAGSPTAAGWGAAMSTDTAFALGLLALVARDVPDRVRIFLLTVAVVDDVVALGVITVGYSGRVSMRPLVVALAVFGLIVVARLLGVQHPLVHLVLGIATWVPLQASGVEPVVLGLVLGLLTPAYAPARSALERATDLVRLFREQPTSALARSAQVGVAQALSPNERLQQRLHPWTGYVIVPLFALANAGVTVEADVVAGALTSPITLGIVAAYVLGKPAGIVGASWLVSRLSRGRVPLPVGWVGLLGTGSTAGIGFTVSLLVATLAFSGPALAQAKLGILAAAVISALVAGLVFSASRRLPPARRTAALLGSSGTLVDLAAPVDPGRDHIRGPLDAAITVVEYGDFQCPFCGQAEPVVRDLLASFEDLRYVWRHLPLDDVHPQARLRAEAAEAAARQGAFWPMHDLLIAAPPTLRPADLRRYAVELDLDADRFLQDLRDHAGAERVARDVESAAASGVAGTPTFFVNGHRQYGSYDIDTLSRAVQHARSVLP